MEITINNNIYKQAHDYAEKHGLNLSTVIENFLLRFIGKNQGPDEEPIPDIVLSLMGAAGSLDNDDLNGREAYYQYLEEKYK